MGLILILKKEEKRASQGCFFSLLMFLLQLNCPVSLSTIFHKKIPFKLNISLIAVPKGVPKSKY